MAGWTGLGRDGISWDGSLRADYFLSGGTSNLKEINATDINVENFGRITFGFTGDTWIGIEDTTSGHFYISSTDGLIDISSSSYLILEGSKVSLEGTSDGVEFYSEAEFDDDVLFSKGTYPMLLTFDSGGLLAFQGTTSGVQSGMSMFTADGSGYGNFFRIYGVGTPASTTNSEYLEIRWAAATNYYRFYSNATGSGTVRPIYFLVGANTVQTWNTDGTTTINKGNYYSADGTQGATGSKSWTDETAGVTHNVTYKNGLITAWSAC